MRGDLQHSELRVGTRWFGLFCLEVDTGLQQVPVSLCTGEDYRWGLFLLLVLGNPPESRYQEGAADGTRKLTHIMKFK